MTDPEHYACYGDRDDDDGQLFFNRRCPKCGRWTKGPENIRFKRDKPTCIADCKKCGKVELDFEGYF